MSEFVCDVYLRSVVLGLIGLGILWAVRRKSASFQHAVAVATVSAALFVPVFRLVLPAQRLAVLPSKSVGVSVLQIVEPRAASVGSAVAGNRLVGLVEPEASPWLFVWAAGCALIICRYGFGVVTLGKWIRAGRTTGPAGSGVLLVKSGFVTVPLTAWLGRRVILLPAGWDAWSTRKREFALCHELAHIRRLDGLTQAVVQLTCAVFWPNPFIWVLCRRCRYLAERAADDAVIESGAAPSDYAQDLLEIAREIKAATPDLSVCMAQSLDVARRIKMILITTKRGKVRFTTIVWTAVALMSLAASVGCVELQQASSALPAGKHQPINQAEPAQIMLAMYMPSPDVTLQKIELRLAKTTSPKPTGELAPSIRPVVFELSKKAVEALSAQWKKAGKIASAPRIRTLSGMPATINVSRNAADSQSYHVTPTYNSDGAMSIDLEIEIRRQGQTTVSQEVNFVIRAGGSVVVALENTKGEPAGVLGMLTATLIGDSGRP